MRLSTQSEITSVYPLWMRVFVIVTGILCLVGVCAVLASVFLPTGLIKQIFLIGGTLAAVFSAFYQVDCWPLWNRYTLHGHRLTAEHMITRKKVVIDSSSVKRVTQFSLTSFKPKQGTSAASNGWRIESQEDEIILLTEALPIFPEIISIFHPMTRNLYE